MLYYS